MSIINLTPHEIINVESGKTYPVSGYVARIDVKRTEIGEFDGSPVYSNEYGEPIVKKGDREATLLRSTHDHEYILSSEDVYIVSGVMCSMLNARNVVSPGELVRDENGKPIGCNGFVASHTGGVSTKPNRDETTRPVKPDFGSNQANKPYKSMDGTVVSVLDSAKMICCVNDSTGQSRIVVRCGAKVGDVVTVAYNNISGCVERTFKPTLSKVETWDELNAHIDSFLDRKPIELAYQKSESDWWSKQNRIYDIAVLFPSQDGYGMEDEYKPDNLYSPPIGRMTLK